MLVNHDLSNNHRDRVNGAATAGCFCCERVFLPSQINFWIDKEQTALCPYCGVDAVLANPTMPTLASMQARWFKPQMRLDLR